jgi:hypothetical protein
MILKNQTKGDPELKLHKVPKYLPSTLTSDFLGPGLYRTAKDLPVVFVVQFRNPSVRKL